MTVTSAGPGLVASPQRLADTDWLHHRLEVTGPAETVRAFAAAARGAGTVPWQLDLAQIEEDLFHRLIAPPPPQRRSLSLVGARTLARQLCEATAARQAAAVARVGLSRVCPFDLHALVPVPRDVGNEVMVELPGTSHSVSARIVDSKNNVVQLAFRQDEATLREVGKTFVLIEAMAVHPQSRAA